MSERALRLSKEIRDVVSGLASLVETTSPDELMITTTSAPTHLRRDKYTVLARELSTRKAHSSR